MAGILLPFTDPDTGAEYPNALRVVTGAEVSQSGNYVAFIVQTYSSLTAQLDGLQPIREDPITLTPSEVSAQIVPLATVLYAVLLARSDFADGIYVP